MQTLSLALKYTNFKEVPIGSVPIVHWHRWGIESTATILDAQAPARDAGGSLIVILLVLLRSVPSTY